MLVCGYRYGATAIICQLGLPFFVFQDFFLRQYANKNCQLSGISKRASEQLECWFLLSIKICVMAKVRLIKGNRYPAEGDFQDFQDETQSGTIEK